MNTAFVKKMLADLKLNNTYPVKGPYMTWKQYMLGIYVNYYFKHRI